MIVIDWLMREMTSARDTGVEWVEGEILEDLDYADDLALVLEGVGVESMESGLAGECEIDSDKDIAKDEDLKKKDNLDD